MNYDIIFYTSIVISIIAFILMVVTFIKCDVLEAIQDIFKFNFNISSMKKVKEKVVKEEKLKDKKLDKKNKPLDEEGTQLLEECDSTTLLEECDSTTLLEECDSTTLLEEGTTLLDSDDENTSLIEDYNGFTNEVIKEIECIFISSNKCI